MILLWWMGALFVIGLAGDEIHKPDHGMLARIKNYIPYLVIWPLLLGRAITIYIDQWERYSLFRVTGIDRNDVGE